jgi:SAM-dependent methyltransferase
MQSAQFQLHAEIEQRHWWFVGRRAIMRRLVRRVVPPSPESTVVDVGCGTGANLASLAEDYDCVGIDTSEEAVRAARRRFPQVKFLVGRAPVGLGPVAERARLFLLMDVLEHVEDDFGMFSELALAASPGSFFLVTVPADPRLWSRHDESFGHFRRYERPRLEQLWRDLPIEPLLVSYYSARMYPLVRAFRGVGRLRGKASGRVGTDFWMPPAPVNRVLTAAFAGEGRKLEAALDGRRRGYRAGSSLIAVLRRTEY